MCGKIVRAHKENARLKLERLEFVGRGAAAAASRRLHAAVGNEARARRAACVFHRGPQDMVFQGTVWGPPLWNVFYADARVAIQSAGFEEEIGRAHV